MDSGSPYGKSTSEGAEPPLQVPHRQSYASVVQGVWSAQVDIPAEDDKGVGPPLTSHQLNAFTPGRFIRIHVLGYRLLDRKQTQRQTTMNAYDKAQYLVSRPRPSTHFTLDSSLTLLAQDEFSWGKFLYVESAGSKPGHPILMFSVTSTPLLQVIIYGSWRSNTIHSQIHPAYRSSALSRTALWVASNSRPPLYLCVPPADLHQSTSSLQMGLKSWSSPSLDDCWHCQLLLPKIGHIYSQR